MNDIKNLFAYATKELEQDAFLRWLFESWKDHQINQIVRHLLEHFCNLEKDDSFEIIKTYAQWKNSDLRIDLITEKRGSVVLLIEDKTFSSEHSDQLKRYNEFIALLPGEIFKVFYKTSRINADEEKRVRDANWEKYDLSSILELFKPFENTSVFLVSQYIEHLRTLDKLYRTNEKPIASEEQNDFIEWESFFNNSIIPSLEQEQFQIPLEIYPCIVHYGYTCLIIEKKREKARITPYLEIRSRDCLNNNFKALVLGYYIDEDLLNKKSPAVIERARASGFWEIKYLRHKDGKEPKQMCFYQTSLKTDSKEEFVTIIKECIRQYAELLDAWDNRIN